MRRLLIVAGLVVAARVGRFARARAENGEWALNPSNYEGADERTFFSYEVRPGQRLVDSVTLTNYSDTPITLELAAVDAYNTADDGAFTLHKPDDAPQDVGAWVRLPVDRWTIAPQSSTDFDFELAVPENVRPGDHAGGILSLAVTASEPDEGEGVAVRKGVGVRIYARVLGDMAPAVLVDQMHTSHGTPWAPFTTSDASVSFRITNTGNVVVAPNIRLEADSPFGALDSADLGPTQELLPGNSIVVTHHWSGVPAGGPVKQRVIVNGEGYEFDELVDLLGHPVVAHPARHGRRRPRAVAAAPAPAARGNRDRRSHAAHRAARASGAGGGKPATDARDRRDRGRRDNARERARVGLAIERRRRVLRQPRDQGERRLRHTRQPRGRGRPRRPLRGQARGRGASGTVPVRHPGTRNQWP